MDNVYAFGAECILFLQKRFAGHDNFFANVNNLADPRYTLTHFFPIISIFDSYFASEFLLATAVGEWVNSILKWIFVEHRPYWWVRETYFYGPIRSKKPQFKLGSQTCETGPGSPSGHVMIATIVLALFSSWILTVLTKRNTISSRFLKGIKIILWLIIAILLSLVTSARLFIATHFPHQCLIGAIFGFLTVHFISNFWMAPFMSIDDIKIIKENPTEKSNLYKKTFKKYILFNLLVVIFSIIIPFALYWGQKFYGFDPLWSVKLAFKWCPSTDFVHFDTTPQYSFVKSTGSILGWVLCSTPSIKSYRYNSTKRSLLLAAFTSLVFQQIFTQWQGSISKDSATYFYLTNFFANTVRPFIFIRVVPMLATFGQKIKTEDVKNKKNPTVASDTVSDKSQ